MKIGYARVSTSDQSLNLQKDALIKAGCYKVYDDIGSGAKAERPGLENAINDLRKNDILVVWKLDRLGRSITQITDKKATTRNKWLLRLKQERGFNKAAVALAHKNARIMLAMIKSGETYRQAHKL